MQNYRNLDAWKKSHAMVLRTYARTATFPKAELFGLTSQMRRAAVSVPANIAEGCYRGERSLAQSLRIALGSAAELEYYVILAGELRLLPECDRDTLAKEISDVKAVITGFMKSVIAAIEAEDRRKTANGQR
jgi:four helix bundle protein